MPLTISQSTTTGDETAVCFGGASVSTDGSLVVLDFGVCSDDHRPLTLALAAESYDKMVRTITDLRGRLAAADGN